MIKVSAASDTRSVAGMSTPHEVSLPWQDVIDGSNGEIRQNMLYVINRVCTRFRLFARSPSFIFRVCPGDWTWQCNAPDMQALCAGKIAYDCREKGRAPTLLTIGALSINTALKVREVNTSAAIQSRFHLWTYAVHCMQTAFNMQSRQSICAGDMRGTQVATSGRQGSVLSACIP